MSEKGKIFRIAGPVVVAKELDARMYDVIRVGNERLMGEVIKIKDEYVTIQVYEDTSGIKPGEPVENTGEQLSVELGPGLLRSIYDGIQRPLEVLQQQMGDFIARGVDAPGLDRKKKWTFKPKVKAGDEVSQGAVLGEVEETKGFIHSILVPAGQGGKVKKINAGDFTVEETICELQSGTKISMLQRWPVRKPRLLKEKLPPSEPLITGQRIFDVLFPLAKGGTAAIPGPFGAGKTVSQQQLAKWCDAEIIVYVGCGERGNEMTEVLTEFPELKDPKTGRPLMNRTVLIANTSNMPVAAREASIYTGVTIAEYFRDMGYNVAIMADSTSRWAEAMREISSRLEEMPGEEGYPAYLATRLAEFYERAGPVENLNGSKGSLTIIGAVSPPGGDFSEPVTQNTLRVTKTFWALDAKLAQKRHFPSINWLTSYSLYLDTLEPFFAKNVTSDWKVLVTRLMTFLQEEDKLLEIVQLVGSDALPDKQQLVLEVARLIREFLLQQNAFHEIDTFCDPQKSHMMIKSILQYADMAEAALEKGVRVKHLVDVKSKDRIGEAKFVKDHEKLLKDVQKEMEQEFEKLARGDGK
ncbi:MAG: V-type ATP synthase subunit A [Candidatus Woesearchaeota archaeon]|jgi:V/A-type H+-transporting ATPase subunit A|nr:V-type ATP synthase subunit A [Candidatus Woesearchaeota archaeon]MDP7323341.1 V-type ATP synthase subunit A [Candidatus Woesearchaeota archaeon]MDP7457350.1 V-type ATP synthase subunit A [Candidatus Woesearchaeota archaeon]